MGSSPIARSIFLRLSTYKFPIIAMFLLSPLCLRAQITIDLQRPFNQGQVIEVPGTEEYLGDLPQEIGWSSDFQPFHTMDGLVFQKVGWAPTPTGIQSTSPALLFEGIPYPFSSSSILSWLPAFRNFELLNFPAAAWWGPPAARGAIQIRLPDLLVSSAPMLGIWCGSGAAGGLDGTYLKNNFSLDGTYQHNLPNWSGLADNLNFISALQLAKTDSFDMKSGVLGAQWLQGNNWYSVFSSLKWESSNFQSIEWKPFFQSAINNGIRVQEYGSDLNYHFTMAGIVESQVGLGLSHDDFSQGFAYQTLNRGYLQNFENIDILGDFKLNAAFRWDFSNEFDTSFNMTAGAQCRMGDVLLSGSYSKSRDIELSEDVQQADFGFKYETNEAWLVGCKYVYEKVGENFWNGSREEIQWGPIEPILFIFQETKIDIEELILINQQGIPIFDTGTRIQWSFFKPFFFRFGGREISSQEFMSEGGLDWLISQGSKVFLSVENINNSPVSWPDLSTSAGRVVWFGGETQF